MTRSLLILAVPLWAFIPKTSAAQTEPAPPPVHVGEAERDQARHLYDEAIKYGKQGDYRKAKASLAAAWALIKTWEIAVNLGSAEMRLGQYRAAAEHLAWGIRDGAVKEGRNYAPLVKAKTLLAEAAGHIGQVKLLADEPGASIFVDEEVVGRSPLVDPLFLDPGAHVITARPANPERASLKLEIRVQPGDALEHYLRFSGSQGSSEKPSESAELATASNPVVYGGSPVEARTVVPVTLGGLTAISAGIALAFTVKASAANGAATDWSQRTGGNCDIPSPACNGLEDARDRRNDANRIANVAWVGAGVFGVSTLATVLFWPRGASPGASAKIRIAPRTGDDMKGVLVMGTF
ncbi:MAG TPA: hypothetical protein VK540_29440 [Polyangiaceae bacterium]|nr:hypothetical protein [Polyangiaceae bacterium]